MSYNPPRQKAPRPTGEPLEIDLVFNVRPCGTCTFFWPDDSTQQPYGPYPTFDFTTNFPIAPDPPNQSSFAWLKGKTNAEAFPNPEIMDGCRKAPIMTVGINPNLTAFAPGTTGTSWAYPNFTSDDGTDEWAKFAYYYRYRSVYQEQFDMQFIKQFLLPEPRVVATSAGVVVSATRTSSSPNFDLKVLYDGDHTPTTYSLTRDTGTPRWVLLVDPYGKGSHFAEGDLLAARLDVPGGEAVEVYRGLVGYYEQFVPTLTSFESFLREKGHAAASLRMGEDVCQLDMVACASPHWGPPYLGGTTDSEHTIIDNCVLTNAWVMKQFVQTRPAVLYLVGEASYNMFYNAFGGLIERDPPLPSYPDDGAFTLLKQTTDPNNPCYFRFATTVDGTDYSVETRLVITPHFSYSTNFTPQIRLSPDAWQQLQTSDPACAQLLEHDSRVTYVPPASKGDYAAFLIKDDVAGLFAEIEKTSPGSVPTLKAGFYDPHQMMADVLEDLYAENKLTYGPVANRQIEALGRTEGSCRFCVNDRWQFPQGCPYGKNEEEPPPAGLLEKVTAALVAAGRPKY